MQHHVHTNNDKVAADTKSVLPATDWTSEPQQIETSAVTSGGGLTAAEEKAALKAKFISGMGRVAAPVSIVATDGPAGRAGVTISAMSSVSADGDRPTLMICLNQSSRTCQALEKNRHFTLNVLNARKHIPIADAFAGRFGTFLPDKFAMGDWKTSPVGIPELNEATAVFHCQVSFTQIVGTHMLIIAEVDEVSEAEGARALVYCSREYRCP
ncbi:flavin reductase [Agrobacterium vitis]|uniref:flavin reductase family protein n=1 Tax=Allorhizobium ampelinum TaxID=3025782 RepID=UPI001F27207B|nr:flavin reductase family protein [Allorhizobium ampelinum]MCF1461846.1 flavin reductase [Allorhizobium ampelinum]